MFSVGPSDTFIGIDLDELPVVATYNVVGIIIDLCLVACELLVAVCRDARIRDSFLLSAILDISGFNGNGKFGRDITSLAELPYYEEFEIERIPRYKQVSYINNHGDEEIEEVEEKESGYICQFSVSEVRQQPENYEELLTELNDDKFIFKKQYHTVQQYMNKLAAKQKTEDDSLLDLL